MHNGGMVIGSNFRLRAFDPSVDLTRIFELRHQAEQFDQDGIAIILNAIRAQLSIPGHDPVRDRVLAVLAQNPNRVVGYAVIWADDHTASVQVVVHPNYRRRGLGSALLDCILDRADELNVTTVNCFAAGGNLAANAFLSAREFIRQGAYTELQSTGEQPLPPGQFPSGFTVRPYSEIRDLGTLTRAMDDCYQGLWGHQNVTETQMAEWLPDFIQQGLFLLFSPDDGNAVGISRVEISKERTEFNQKLTGYIDAPGILPNYRDRDLYLPLLLHGMHWLQEQKVELIEMESWGDDPALLASYQSYGFKTVRSQISYQKRIG